MCTLYTITVTRGQCIETFFCSAVYKLTGLFYRLNTDVDLARAYCLDQVKISVSSHSVGSKLMKPFIRPPKFAKANIKLTTVNYLTRMKLRMSMIVLMNIGEKRLSLVLCK